MDLFTIPINKMYLHLTIKIGKKNELCILKSHFTKGKCIFPCNAQLSYKKKITPTSNSEGYI